MPEDYASQFMLQEYSRIIDAYHDLHVQKNELIKFYLTFVSLPVSIVVIFLSLYKYLQLNPQLGSVLDTLRSAGIYLSILLVFVGLSVLMVMLNIRGEQYLYVKTINGARQYFRDKHAIEVVYLVLPSQADNITFGKRERWGRAFWETMIVCSTTSMLVTFLCFEFVAYHLGPQGYWRVASLVVIVFVLSMALLMLFVRHQLQSRLDNLKLIDVGFPGKKEFEP